MSLNLIKPIEPLQRKAALIIYTLVFTLVFEGILRKLVPSAIGLAVFFLKDALCLLAFFYVAKYEFNGLGITLVKAWKYIFIAFLPLFIAATFHDPILGFYGLKQYLLYPVVGLLLPIAFITKDRIHFSKITTVFISIIIPTTLIAIFQNALPATHWLNRSVDGGSLDGFSAAGYLRVSSTFSFTGQYSWFLNMISGFVAVNYFILGSNRTVLQNIILAVSTVCLVVGVFITGGRTAVVGTGVCLGIGYIFSTLKWPQYSLKKGIIAISILFVLITGIRAIKPEFFAAYDKRSSGSEEKSHSAEIEERVFGDLFNWTDWLFLGDLHSVLIGNGISVMSNGSEKISPYAKEMKDKWGGGLESDLDTTAWEGGIYLMLVWYGFRLWVIIFCINIWYQIKDKYMGTSVSFLLGFVISSGCLGTIAKQAPINIWWWFTVGCIVTIKKFYDDRSDQKITA